MAHRWRVIRTQPRAEYLAAKELGHDGFEVYFPRVKATISRIGHMDVPLFPGYLFLKWDSESQGWPVFRPAHRVLGWVMVGGEIPSLPDEYIGELTQKLESIDRDGGIWRRFRQGEKVMLISNGIESLAQVLENSKSPRAPAKVLMEFMGRLVRTQVPWDHLRPLGDGPEEIARAPRRTRGKGRWVGAFRSTAAASA